MPHPSLEAQARPEKPAYIMAATGETVSYRALDEHSNQGARLFRELGLVAGDHIALCLENNARFFEICWAAQRAGLYFTPISTHLTAGEVAYIVQDSGARLVIASKGLEAVASELAMTLKEPRVRFVVGGAVQGYERWEKAVARQETTPIADEVMGYPMLYSSGTTGRPKGVKQPFVAQPISEAQPVGLLLQALYGFDGETIYLSPAPLYHAAPLAFNMTVQALGGTCVIMDRFDPERFLRLIESYRITHTQLVPTMFVRLTKLPQEIRERYDLSSLRCAIHAAAPCPIAVKQAMIDWWGPIIHEYYGGSEGNGFTAISSAEWLAHKGSVGRSMLGEIKIFGADGAELPPGEAGLVYFKGGRPFAYHNDPAKTAEAYNDDGWSTIGDIGYLDPEGYLYLTDRKAFTIVSGGVNIYPRETEDVLITHPMVADVAVFGVPNEEFGEEVKAVVQPADMAEAGEALAAELMAHCRRHLSPIKCPKSIDFEAELPRSATGKLYKRLLRDRYWGKHETHIV